MKNEEVCEKHKEKTFWNMVTKLAIKFYKKSWAILQRCRFTKQMKTRRKVNHEASDVTLVEASVEIISDEISEKELVAMLYRENGRNAIDLQEQGQKD